jgi:leader peptidase (prepilin peptidase)/N-methyltransferase
MVTLILMKILFIVLAFFLGASLASFSGVLIERIPKKESINGRSHCACGRQLKWYENVPVIGWLSIRGVAKCCGARLPVWYVIFELAAGLVFAGLTAWYFFGVL